MIFTRALFLFVVATAGAFGAEPAKAPGVPVQAQAVQMPAAQVPAAPTLGRLFFSAPERVALDEARLRPPAVATATETKSLPPAPEYVMLNGVVRRSDGSTSVWLNNRMLEGKRTNDGMEVTDSRRAPGAANVTVRVPQAGRSVDLRVGQRLDVTSGRVQERYQVAPMTSPSSSSSETASTESASAPPRSPSRRPSRERERREPNRDVETAPVERSEPPQAGKG